MCEELLTSFCFTRCVFGKKNAMCFWSVLVRFCFLLCKNCSGQIWKSIGESKKRQTLLCTAHVEMCVAWWHGKKCMQFFFKKKKKNEKTPCYEKCKCVAFRPRSQDQYFASIFATPNQEWEQICPSYLFFVQVPLLVLGYKSGCQILTNIPPCECGLKGSSHLIK